MSLDGLSCGNSAELRAQYCRLPPLSPVHVGCLCRALLRLPGAGLALHQSRVGLAELPVGPAVRIDLDQNRRPQARNVLPAGAIGVAVIAVHEGLTILLVDGIVVDVKRRRSFHNSFLARTYRTNWARISGVRLRRSIDQRADRAYSPRNGLWIGNTALPNP